ncbi:hypothetical protein [Halorubrum tebenquichense]|uniref:hypothetical protein n=1 Tax=Halorubrum tebenquichense TaxID=119434 RepID=UPI00126856F3|nr:hypothetical protein [Halorubrum tebenquichense]
MTLEMDDHPFIRHVGFVIVSIVLFLIVAWIFGIEFTEQVRTQIYIATGAGLGLAFARNAVRRLLRSAGRGSEFVVLYSSYRALGERFVVLWMLGFIVLTVISGGSVDLVGFKHVAMIVLMFVLAIASASFPNLNRTLRDMVWILTAIASAAVVVFLLYSVVESIVSTRLDLLSFSTTIELLEPVIASAVVIGAIQVIIGRTVGPTTRELEYDRHPSAVSVSSDNDEKFLEAVQELAEIWEENTKSGPRRHSANARQTSVTISVNGKQKADYNIELGADSDRWGYSRIVSEIGDKNARWISREGSPQYPDKVETAKFLQLKVITDVSSLGIKERVYLRIQAVKRSVFGSNT